MSAKGMSSGRTRRRVRWKSGGKLLAVGLAVTAAAGLLGGCVMNRDNASSAPIARAATTAAATTAPATAPTAKDPFPKLTAEQVLARAETAMNAVGSMMVDLSAKDDTGSLRFKTALTRSGKCAAAVRVDGTQLDIIVLGGHGYLKADGAYWRAQDRAHGDDLARLLGGRWAKLPAKVTAGAGFDAFCSLKKLLTEFESDDHQYTTVKGDLSLLGGRPVQQLVQLNGDISTTVYVAATGTPYILKTTVGQDGSNVATFTGFNKPLSVNPPPASQTVDVSALMLPGGNGFSV